MRRILLRLTTGLVTFIVGASITSVSLFLSRPLLGPNLSVLPLPTEETAPEPVEYPEYPSLEPPDWKPYLTCEEFSSPAHANEALREALFGAKVITQGDKMNRKGQRIGKRVVAFYCCGREGQQSAQVFWTDGAKLCELAAPTVRQALEFERAKKP